MSSTPLLATLAAVVLSSVAQVLAQDASHCGVQSRHQYLNASREYLMRDPLSTPSGLLKGGSSDWKWSIGTVSHNLTEHGKKGSLSQNLWLKTESSIDLTSHSLGYTGCGAIMHGLTYAATVNGQADTGDCGLTLSSQCRRAIQQDILDAAESTSDLTGQSSNRGIGAAKLCEKFKFGIPSACDAFFTKDSWIQTFVFASPDSHAICPKSPAASKFNQPLASWSPLQNAYSPKNMETYNNLTTAISPLITTMFTNQTASDTGSVFISHHLNCLRPANISPHSAKPATIPGDNTPNLLGAVSSATVKTSKPTKHSATSTKHKTLSAKKDTTSSKTHSTTSAKSETPSPKSTTPSTKPTLAPSSTTTHPTSAPTASAHIHTGGADGLKLVMDWVCVLGISGLFWRVLLG